jgi:cyclase
MKHIQTTFSLLMISQLSFGQATALQNAKTTSSYYQSPAEDSISIRTTRITGNLYMLDCVNGFGGGNVTALVGEEGILLADNMYASMSEKIKAALKTISDKPVRIVLNSHFHGDHIEGNKNFRSTAIIIAQENLQQRLKKGNRPNAPTGELMPAVIIHDSLTIQFNNEEIKMIHFPNSHTDGDLAIYFTKSKVAHLGDLFFFGMFPAIYTEGGGNIIQLIRSLETILRSLPADAKIVPGHGELATMKDLADYITMLKETTEIVTSQAKQGKTLEQMQKENVLSKYTALGDGGAQTTQQYLAMLYKLLVTQKQP